MKTKGRSDKADIIIGQNLRSIRKDLNLSQEQVAKGIGVTFQQIQKYESGLNRISGSRFVELSKTLDVPIDAFFEGLTPKPLDQEYFLGNRIHHEIIQILQDVNDEKIEIAFLNLSKAFKQNK